MKEMYIITGKDEHKISKKANQLRRKGYKNGGIYYKINFPEDRKHICQYCNEVYKQIQDNKDDSIFVITTFSNSILNMIGEMIEKKYLDYSKILVYLEDKEERAIRYTEEGYLGEGYPIDYFVYNMDK